MELSKEYLKMKADAPQRGKLAGGQPLEHFQALRAAKPGKKVRHVFIEATFPELKGGQMYQHAHGEASSTKPAIARAFKNLLKTIPKKRISVISAKISITTKTVEDTNVKV